MGSSLIDSYTSSEIEEIRKTQKSSSTFIVARVYTILSRSATENSSPVVLARTSAISSRMHVCASGCCAIAWKYHSKVLAEVSCPAEMNVLLFYRRRKQHWYSKSARDARDLIDQFIIGHLVLGIRRFVRAQ